MEAKTVPQTANPALTRELEILDRARASNLPQVYVTAQEARVRELQHAESHASTP